MLSLHQLALVLESTSIHGVVQPRVGARDAAGDAVRTLIMPHMSCKFSSLAELLLPRGPVGVGSAAFLSDENAMCFAAVLMAELFWLESNSRNPLPVRYCHVASWELQRSFLRLFRPPGVLRCLGHT